MIRLGIVALTVVLACRAGNGQSFSDNFNRPDGPVGNGWSVWGNPNVSIVSDQLRTFGQSGVGGGIARTQAVSFPLSFSFDFSTLNVTPDYNPSLPYNDGGWFIAFNAVNAAYQAPAEIAFYQYAGSRNINRTTSGVSDAQPNVAEPIPGWQDFGAAPAHITGTVNADLSATIKITYANGQIVSVAFGPRCASSCPGSGSFLLLGNSNASAGPDFFDNLQIAGCVNATDVKPIPSGPYSRDLMPESMTATFEPTDSDGHDIGLIAQAKVCNFTTFDWQQQVRVDPYDYLLHSTLSPAVPLSAPYPDPPPGGYTYQTMFPFGVTLQYIANAAYPFYWALQSPTTWIPSGSEPYYPLSLQANENPPTALLACSNCLYFMDIPQGPFTDGQDMEFTTTLVGVVGDSPGATAVPLYTWSWSTTFNGTTGGVTYHVPSNTYPPDPGSGTGGVTITNINGVQLPPVVPSSHLTITASGLAYSRVSQTFNGTVTISNISSDSISGPLQILFFGMPAGVTLINATNNLSGTPYLTVPATEFAPGKPVTVSVQFKNPSNTTIHFVPVTYSGSI